MKVSEDYIQSLGNDDEEARQETSGDASDLWLDSLPQSKPSSASRRIERDMQTRPVVICAEAGMNVTAILGHIARQVRSRGGLARFEDLSNMGEEDISRKLASVVKWCSRFNGATEGLAVLCTNMPGGDEREVFIRAQLFKRMIDAGAMLVVAGTPDNIMLAEALGDVTCYRSCDLCLDRCDLPDLDDGALALTHRIPALVDALERLDDVSHDAAFTDPRFQEAYERMVAGSLRESLISEELRLRVAMLLLGSGSRGELLKIMGAIDDGLWRDLACDAPFYGVDLLQDAFACVGSHTCDGLAVIYPLLDERCADLPDVVERVAWSLAGRQQYSRAALVASLCSDADVRCRFLVSWAGELLNVGEVAIIKDAIARMEHDGIGTGDAFAAARVMLGALSCDGESPATLVPRMDAETPYALRASLSSWCVALLGDVTAEHVCDLLDATQLCEADAIAESLLLHGRAWRLFAQGSFERAYLLLAHAPERFDEGSVTGALLATDYVLCSLFAGIAPNEADMGAFDRAGVFLEQCGLKSLCSFHDVIIPLGGVLMGRCLNERLLELHAQRASRCGATFLYGLCLLAAAVDDMRSGVLIRSHVRLGLARKAFCEAHAPMFADASGMLADVVHALLGTQLTKRRLLEYGGANTDMGHVTEVLCAAISAKRRARPEGADRWGSGGCPRQVLWLVAVLSRDCGMLSRRFHAAMPRSWRESLERVSSELDRLFVVRGASDEGFMPLPSAPMPAAEGEQRTTGAAPRVEITLLGGFGVRVNGVSLLGRRMERRRAKSMLVLLAAIPGHVAKRYTIMESVWPEHDYESANKCVYSATSVLRSELCPAKDEEKPPAVVVSNKAEGTLTLDAEIVRCDVDAFEAAARRALDSEGDDRLVVQLCREVEELYKGDLYVPPNDGAGIVGRRSQELRDLYADTMIAGAHAASVLGMKMLACRFARKAHGVDNMREDAMRALIVSFCAAGRHIEAQQCYESYARKMINTSCRPPSRRLRKLVEELVLKPDETAQAARGTSGARRAPVEVVGSYEVLPSGQLSFDMGESWIA